MSDLYPITHDIYALPGDMTRTRPWLGVVLIDSGNGPLQAADLQRALDERGAPPVTHILLTHHHWDHHFGSVAFPDATIIAHELTQKHLLVMAAEPWSREYVLRKGEGHPRGQAVARMMNRAVPDWSEFRACPATVTFTDSYVVTAGGYRFEMLHVGGQHEPDQIIVLVEPGRVLFLGDATYGRASSTNDWDKPALAETLHGFVRSTGAEWFVEGHRTPTSREQFEARIERLANAD